MKMRKLKRKSKKHKNNYQSFVKGLTSWFSS